MQSIHVFYVGIVFGADYSFDPDLVVLVIMDVGSTRSISIRTNLLPQGGTTSGGRPAVRGNRKSLIGKGYRVFGGNRFDKRVEMCYSISIEYVLWQLV
jgi:hypothetical protein